MGLTFELFRFLVYEYMANGSLKDHLHCMFSSVSNLVYMQSIYLKLLLCVIWNFTASGRKPLSWQTRLQIAMDVANALVCSPLQIELIHALSFVRALVKKTGKYSLCLQCSTSHASSSHFSVTTVFDLFYLFGFIFKLKTILLSFFVAVCLTNYSIWNKSIKLRGETRLQFTLNLSWKQHN